jgi:hypothetical protein
MATITLTANTAYSALTLANNDTIDCAGFVLTLDIQPTHTGISVTTPGTAGTVTISGAWDLSTWSFTAGTTTIITTNPVGCTIGSVTAGSATNARGCVTNNGTIVLCTGSPSAYGCNTNSSTGVITTCVAGGGCGCLTNEGLITTLTGNPAAYTFNCQTNHNTIMSVTGGNLISARGVATNYGTIYTCTGGSAATAYGCDINYGIIHNCIGGSNATAYGCNQNFAQVLAGSDATARAAGSFRGSIKFVNGPDFQTTIVSSDLRYDPLETLYTLNGPLSNLAVVPVGVTVIELSEGTAGFTGLSGVGRLGT